MKSMSTIALLLLALIAATSGAPVQQQEADVKTITGQAKRADEFILYGNHQNNGRIKKNDPAMETNDVPSNKINAVDEAVDEAVAPSTTDNTLIEGLQQPVSNTLDETAPEAAKDDGSSEQVDDADFEDYLYGYRAKRSVPLTAENMLAGTASRQATASSRKRRDLTDAEIAALLEARQLEQDQLLRPDELDDVWRQELAGLYGPGDVQEQPLDNEAMDARAVLQYLYGDNAENDIDNDVSGDFVEKSAIEPMFYHGRPGVFVPVKRQFISAVPGVRKRSGGYGADDNHAYLNDYVGALERRRNEEERDRLYELALALNAADEL